MTKKISFNHNQAPSFKQIHLLNVYGGNKGEFISNRNESCDDRIDNHYYSHLSVFSYKGGNRNSRYIRSFLKLENPSFNKSYSNQSDY